MVVLADPAPTSVQDHDGISVRQGGPAIPGVSYEPVSCKVSLVGVKGVHHLLYVVACISVNPLF